MVPRTAADCIIIRPAEGEEYEVLLITRKKPGPSHGKHAFPGGHIDYNEDPKDAALRELEEECGVKGASPELFTVRGGATRDDRYHMISIFFLAELVDKNSQLVASDDALSAKWYNLREMLTKPEIFAFDHLEVLREVVNSKSHFRHLITGGASQTSPLTAERMQEMLEQQQKQIQALQEENSGLRTKLQKAENL